MFLAGMKESIKKTQMWYTVIYKRVNLQIKTEKIPLQVLIILLEKLQI